jgi:hypothetical protein
MLARPARALLSVWELGGVDFGSWVAAGIGSVFGTVVSKKALGALAPAERDIFAPFGRSDRARLDEAGGVEHLRLHPTMIDGCAVHEADAEAGRWARERLRERSAPYGTSFERDGAALVVSP